LVRVETEYEFELGGDSKERIYDDSGSSRNSGTRKLHEEEKKIRCELDPEDRAVVGKYFVPVNGIEDSKLKDVVSGDTTLMAAGATILDGEMWLPADAEIEFGSNNRRLIVEQSRTHGIKKVLVVRADGQGSVTTADSVTLSDKVFGTYGDKATLKSQYLACSHGKLELQPYSGVTRGGAVITNGVLDVSIDTYVPGTSRFDVEDALEQAADSLTGGFQGQFDHVMLCLPPGSTNSRHDANWVAYGYIGSWLSVYNDDYCSSMSTQVHEIGHNFGLAHSGKDEVSYGDKSGMMGYSYKQDNGPLQCFNPAKTYQLGWMNDKAVEVDPNVGTWVGTIIGPTDYSNAVVDPNAKVIVKIKTGDFEDLFIGYNRKKGMNSGVNLGGDMVTIVQQAPGYSQSDYLASLSPGDQSEFLASLTSQESTKTFENFGGTGRNLVVDFMGRGSSDDEAKVAIYFDTCVYPSCCTGSMCGQLVTPVLSPIAAPIQNQLPVTAKPTAKPTSAPIQTPMYQISYNSNQNERKELLSEKFHDGLGAFSPRNGVQQYMFQYILTAQFKLTGPNNLPSMSTVLDLQQTSIVEVSFWYNAEKMQNQDGFRLQYSNNHGKTWTDVRSYKFGENGFDTTDKWFQADKETFVVTQGISTTQIRFIGETTRSNSDSTFYISGVDVFGTAQ